MLDGDIQILHDLGLLGDDVDELVGDLVGIEIVEADPVDPLDGAQLGQEPGQGPLPVEVQAVPGNVLGHHDELLHPRLGQVLRLGQDRLLGAAAELPPDEGDHAVGAPVVAALGDPQPGPVVRGADHPVGLRHRGVHVPEAGGTLVPGGGLDDRGDVLIAPHAHEAVGGGADLVDGILPPLGHAAGDHDLPQPALRLQLGQLFDLRQGLVPGLFEKAAGVHHGHVAVLGPQGHLMAGLVGLPDHLLAVDLVLGAAKGDKSYFHGIHPQNNTAGCSGPSNADYFCSLGQTQENPSAPRANRAAVDSRTLL